MDLCWMNIFYILLHMLYFFSEFTVDSLFFANSNYADEFQMNVAHDDIGTCLVWSLLLLWTMTTPPYLSWWVWHWHGVSIPLCTGYQCTPTWLVAKKWIGLRQSSKSYGGFGYFILTWNTQKTEWFTYSHLFTDQHSTLKAKTLTKAMCMKWLQVPSWWSGNECSLGVDTVFEILNIFGIFRFYKLFMFIYNFSVNVN